MKRLLLVVSVGLASLLAASACFARGSVQVSGINLAWDNCVGDAGTANKVFACASNSGTNVLVGSYMPSAEEDQVSGNEVVVDFLTTTSPAPQWWAMKNTGSCRQTALSANFTAPGSAVNCMDAWQGQASGGIGSYSQTTNTSWSINPGDEPAHYRAVLAIALPPTGLAQVVPGTEYFSFNLVISNAKTTGTGSCAGCSDPVCIVLNSINVTQPVGVGDFFLGNAAAAGSNVVTWQGGVSGGCAAVPTKNVTWGAIKSMYR